MGALPVPMPADYFALTRILSLFPSVWEEPFGRVAAEAMINWGIPALVSRRGLLPRVVGGDFSEGGGGRVLRVLGWMTFQTTELPTEKDTEPWDAAVTALWDDPTLYEAMSLRARDIATARYSERCVATTPLLEDSTSLRPRSSPIRRARGGKTPRESACRIPRRSTRANEESRRVSGGLLRSGAGGRNPANFKSVTGPAVSCLCEVGKSGRRCSLDFLRRSCRSMFALYVEQPVMAASPGPMTRERASGKGRLHAGCAVAWQLIIPGSSPDWFTVPR